MALQASTGILNTEPSSVLLSDLKLLEGLVGRFNNGRGQLYYIYKSDPEAVLSKTPANLFTDVYSYEIQKPNLEKSMLPSFKTVDYKRQYADLKERRNLFFRCWLDDLDSSSESLKEAMRGGSMTIGEIIDTWDSAISHRLGSQLASVSISNDLAQKAAAATSELGPTGAAADAQVVFDGEQESMVV